MVLIWRRGDIFPWEPMLDATKANGRDWQHLSWTTNLGGILVRSRCHMALLSEGMAGGVYHPPIFVSMARSLLLSLLVFRGRGEADGTDGRERC